MTQQKAIRILMQSPFYFKLELVARKLLIKEFCALHNASWTEPSPGFFCSARLLAIPCPPSPSASVRTALRHAHRPPRENIFSGLKQYFGI